MPMSQLDQPQVIKTVYDSTNEALRVNLVATSGSSTAINDGVNSALKATVTSSNELKVLATAQPGTDIGDVTVNNAAGASAVNIQDGGNSITVDGVFFQATQPVSGTVAATQSGTWNITNISGTISLPTGAATESTLSTLNGKIPSNLTVSSTRLLVDASGTTQPVSSTLDSSSISTLSNVSGSATSVSLLASTAGRKAAYFFNDSTAILYLKFGTTASTTSYTVQIQPGGFFEMPPKPVYTGAIDGIWSAANGAARITELS